MTVAQDTHWLLHKIEIERKRESIGQRIRIRARISHLTVALSGGLLNDSVDISLDIYASTVLGARVIPCHRD